METIMTVGLFWTMYFIIMAAVYKLHDVWTPEPFSMFDKYPWKCCKCLTTWSLVGSYISVAYMLHSPAFGFWGCLLAAGTGLAWHITDKERFINDTDG